MAVHMGGKCFVVETVASRIGWQRQSALDREGVTPR
jgi:hypothetical protein